MLTDQLKETIQTAYTTLLENKSLKARYGQRLMIADVARTLASKPEQTETPVCVVEAGTGTGKTIAYTVAAVPVAAAIISHIAPLLGLEPNEKLDDKKWDCPRTDSINWAECLKVN